MSESELRYNTAAAMPDAAVPPNPRPILATTTTASAVPDRGEDDGEPLRTWHHRLYTQDRDSLLESLLCSCCQLSRQYNMVHYGRPEVDWAYCIGTFSWNLLLCNVPGSVAMCSLRQQLRSRYSIMGTGSEDFCTVMLCPCCALQQQLLEMKTVGCGPGAFFGHFTSPVEAFMM